MTYLYMKVLKSRSDTNRFHCSDIFHVQNSSWDTVDLFTLTVRKRDKIINTKTLCRNIDNGNKEKCFDRLYKIFAEDESCNVFC